MKKTSVFRIVSLMLALILCFGLIGCSKTDNKEKDDDDDDNNPSTETVERTDETRFAELKAAYEKTMKYNEDVTITAVQKQKREYENQEYNEEAIIDAIMSIDTKGGVFYGKSTENYSDTTNVETEKAFVVDGTYYLFEQDERSGKTEKDYSKYVSGDPLSDDDVYFVSELVDSVAGGLFVAKSFREVKNAFSTTYAQLQSNDIAFLEKNGLLKENTTFTITPEVSIEDREDGTVTIYIKSTIKATELENAEGSLQKKVSAILERTISCKDGKINECIASFGYEVELSESNSAFPEMVKMYVLINYGLDYSFDKKGYDEIAVSLPTNPEEIDDYHALVKSAAIEVQIGTLTSERYLTDGTIDQMLSALEIEITWQFGEVWTENNGVLPAVEVKGFYKDAALTQKITSSNTTAEQMLALDKVYVDYELAAGHSLVQESYETEEKFSNDYKIIYATVFGYGMSQAGAQALPEGATVNLEFATERDATFKVLINGVETTDKELTVTAGKTYKIEYVTIVEDKNLGFNYIIGVPLF